MSIIEMIEETLKIARRNVKDETEKEILDMLEDYAVNELGCD